MKQTFIDEGCCSIMRGRMYRENDQYIYTQEIRDYLQESWIVRWKEDDCWHSSTAYLFRAGAEEYAKWIDSKFDVTIEHVYQTWEEVIIRRYKKS